MGRFGAVSYRAVKTLDNDTHIEMGATDKSGKKIPLSKLSIVNNAPNVAELTLKRPTMEMAKAMVIALFPYYWTKNPVSLRLRVLISVSLIFVSKGINLYVPLIFKNIINSLPDNVPVKAVVMFGALTIVQKTIWDVRDLIFQDVTDGATKTISLETFDHLHKLSLSYHLSKRSGSLVRIVDRGTQSIVTLLSLLLFNIFPTLLELVTVTFFLLFSYGSTFAFINLCACTFYITFTLLITEWRNQFRRLANKKENEASDVRMESMTNFETIKYFTAEASERERYHHALHEFFLISHKSKISYFILNAGQSSIITIGATLGLLFATYSAANGGFSVGDIIAINTYTAQMFAPLSWLGTSYRMIIQSFTDMENLIDLLNTRSDVEDSPNAVPLEFSSGSSDGDSLPSIEFENVSFYYKDDVRILENISFSVPPGKSVALVGPTGGGKSTIFRLLCRFYDVKEGAIRIGSQDIRDVSQVSLRGAIGVVPQDTVLFNDTIAFNIGFGKRECEDDELIEAARRAQILDFIEASPDKFSTVVGERGLRLSGGEKQRVAIARTLLKNPPILILDEATSALDSKTEKKIQQSLNDISKGRTTLVIAHRLSTIVHCDEILVLKHGGIVERGDHNTLLEMNGEYASLWYQQLERPTTTSSAPSDTMSP
eukprot:gene12474-14635_t